MANHLTVKKLEDINPPMKDFIPMDYGDLNEPSSPELRHHKSSKHHPPQAINLNQLYLSKPSQASRRSSHRKRQSTLNIANLNSNRGGVKD